MRDHSPVARFLGTALVAPCGDRTRLLLPSRANSGVISDKHNSTGPLDEIKGETLQNSLRQEFYRFLLKYNSLPAEVEERPAGLRDVLVEPGQEVELSDGSCLVGLHVL